MVIAVQVMQILYAVVGVALALLVLVLVQYQFGSVGNLLRRWTMSEFRHVPKHTTTHTVTASESASAPVHSHSAPSQEDPVADILQMKPVQQAVVQQSPLQTKSTDPVIQKMKQLYYSSAQ